MGDRVSEDQKAKMDVQALAIDTINGKTPSLDEAIILARAYLGLQQALKSLRAATR